MNINIPGELQPFVTGLVQSGAFANEQEVIHQALREYRDSQAERDQLRLQIQEGIDSPSVSEEELWTRLERRMDEFERQQP